MAGISLCTLADIVNHEFQRVLLKVKSFNSFPSKRRLCCALSMSIAAELSAKTAEISLHFWKTAKTELCRLSALLIQSCILWEAQGIQEICEICWLYRAIPNFTFAPWSVVIPDTRLWIPQSRITRSKNTCRILLT